MIDTKWRKPFQTLVINPLLQWPVLARCSPLLLTLISFLSGLSALICLNAHATFIALAFLVLSGLCDVLDGSLARAQEQASPLGAACDITSDRFVEFAILLGLYLYDPTRALYIILMLGATLLCVTTFLVVGVFSENDSEKSFHYSTGLVERAEAFIFFALMILVPGWFIPLSLLFTSLVSLTAAIRLYQFTKIYSKLSSK